MTELNGYQQKAVHVGWHSVAPPISLIAEPMRSIATCWHTIVRLSSLCCCIVWASGHMHWHTDLWAPSIGNLYSSVGALPSPHWYACHAFGLLCWHAVWIQAPSVCIPWLLVLWLPSTGVQLKSHQCATHLPGSLLAVRSSAASAAQSVPLQAFMFLFFYPAKFVLEIHRSLCYLRQKLNRSTQKGKSVFK